MKFTSAIKRIFSFFLIILVLALPLMSSSYAEAEAGDADAVFEEGMRYFSGDGVDQDIVKGLSLIVEAVQGGSAKAMLEIGILYSKGLGPVLSQDFEEGSEVELALSWYEKAALAGAQEEAAAAMSNDAFAYFLGSEDGSVQEDDAAALMYFQKAAEYGDPSAINMMVAFYTYGFGVEQNPDKALELSASLAEKGDSEALHALEEYAYAYYAGTTDGIDINFNTSFNYYNKLADLGNERAMYNIGLLYEYGLGTPADHDKAIEWLSRALDAGYEPAKAMLDSLQNSNN